MYNICKFLVHILLKPSLENFLRITLLVCEMSTIVQKSEHSLALERKLTFSSPVAAAEFSKFAGRLSAALSQHNL